MNRGRSRAAVESVALRRLIIDQSRRANVGHIGSNLSIADVIAVVFGRILNVPSPDDPDRDRFILSKGHASLALYAALYLQGRLTKGRLDTYCDDDTVLGTHPEHVTDGIDFSTGSLGHGLSMGAGAALAARLDRSSRRVFVLVSDAECNEGALWEAVMFAAHHQLANLVAIVDLNGQQAFGYTREVLDLTPMADRWRAFGWDVHEIDGHDERMIESTISALETSAGPPHVVIARTVFGKGVGFMEGQIKWHYAPLSDEDYVRALAELGSNGGRRVR